MNKLVWQPLKAELAPSPDKKTLGSVHLRQWFPRDASLVRGCNCPRCPRHPHRSPKTIRMFPYIVLYLLPTDSPCTIALRFFPCVRSPRTYSYQYLLADVIILLGIILTDLVTICFYMEATDIFINDCSKCPLMDSHRFVFFS